MTVDAVGLLPPGDSRSVTPDDVLSLGNSFEVVRSDACRVTTEMVDNQPSRDRAVGFLVEATVRVPRDAIASLASVTTRSKSPLPNPTAVRLNHVFDKRFAGVMSGTETKGLASNDPSSEVTTGCERGGFAAATLAEATVAVVHDGKATGGVRRHHSMTQPFDLARSRARIKGKGFTRDKRRERDL